MRQEPRRHGLTRHRWRLADLAAVVPAFAGYSTSGVSRALKRLGIRLKRGRLRLHSPDPAYADKVARIARARRLARRHPERCTLLYADEASCYRQPTLGGRYYPVGEEPTTRLSHAPGDTRLRISGALNAVTGQVTTRTGATMNVPALCRFLHQVRQAYPTGVVFLVWDNWLVHRHETVVAKAAALRIHILWLPTYAPWENPIEKLWRWLKQAVVHDHALAEDWPALQRAVKAFLRQFAAGSEALLRYVGLLPK